MRACRTMFFHTLLLPVAAAVVLLSGTVRLAAQSAPDRPTDAVTPCVYTRCALGISPAWNGLLVTRGVGAERVANLGFFWTRSLDHVFAGSDSARHAARRAVRVRRVAALLTDAGLVTLGYATLRAAHDGRLDATGRVVAVAGATAFAISVPLQFVADGHLSRAVWWHNGTYATQ